MSLLCRNNMIDHPNEYSEEQILSVISMSSKPNALQYLKIGKTHNPTVGHFGVESTLIRFIDKEDIWKFRRQHIKNLLRIFPVDRK